MIFQSSSINNTEDHIMHYGIRGQRWGVIRYRNKDGSLTPAGQKRLDKLKKKYNELAKGSKSVKKKKNKNEIDYDIIDKTPIKKLTNKQLEAKIKRLKAEDEAKNLHYKTRTSSGKKIVSTFGNRVVAPALIDAGKNVLTRYFEKVMTDKIGLDGIVNNTKKKKKK